MNSFLEAIAIFSMMFGVDVFWTNYIQAVADKKALKAASYSAAIILLGGFTVLAYTERPIMLIVAALGAFFGTLVTVRKEAK